MTEHPPASRTIRVGDIDMAYIDQGAGIPVILLHGGLAPAAFMWGDRIADLARSYRVLAPDTRSHGGTNNPGGQLSYEQLADDTAGFIDALNLDRPFLVGYSDGGQTGIELGRRHPGKVRAMVLGGTQSRNTQRYRDSLVQMGFVAAGRVNMDILRAAFGSYFQSMQDANAAQGTDHWPELLAEVAQLWHGLPNYSEEQLAAVTEPSMVITGDRDEFAGPEDAVRLFRALPNAELSILPFASHGSVETDLFWLTVEDFLRRHVTS